jgi:hypothetical protein
MSPMNVSSPGSNRPSANVYTSLALIAMFATLAAAAFFAWKCMELGIFS